MLQSIGNWSIVQLQRVTNRNNIGDIMILDLTKRDLEVLLYASAFFTEAPGKFDSPEYKKDYEHWQKLHKKLWFAIHEME